MEINGLEGICTGNNVRIRSSMDTSNNSNILKEISKGEKLKLFKRSGNWYEVYFGKSGGYISADYVKILPINGIVTSKNGLNVRQKPSQTSSKIGVLSYNSIVKIDANYNSKEWYSVFFGKNGGYVAKKYINITNATNLNTCEVSKELIDFVKSYEGFYSKKYLDCAGVPTIGYGSTHGWIMNKSSVTEAEATQALMEEISVMAKQIKNDLDAKNVKLNQNQFDALCSFAYNCGTGALFSSTLYSRICEGVRGSYLKANFTAWCNAGGRQVKGLLNRRIEEYEMFTNADYKRNL